MPKPLAKAGWIEIGACKYEAASKIVNYDRKTGLFTWRETLNYSRVKGEVAGKASSYGHLAIYLRRPDKKSESVQLHRLAWFMAHGEVVPDGVFIDHINRDPADNRIENLRLATPAQNTVNGPTRSNKTGFKGVKFDRSTGKFIATIGGNGRPSYKYLGSFETPEQASEAYQAAAKERYGEYRMISTVGEEK